jgi:lactate permease
MKDQPCASAPRVLWTALAALFFVAPYFVLSRWVGPELPTLGGALIGGTFFVAALRLMDRRQFHLAEDRRTGARQSNSALRAGAPYLILVALILLTRLTPLVQEALSGVVWEWSLLGRFRGSIQPLYHPGTMLFLGFLIGARVQRASKQDMVAAAAGAAGQLVPVTVALVAMLGLSRVMVHSGMIDNLAMAAASAAGDGWPFFAPFVGALGTFVTGSATASNILVY